MKMKSVTAARELVRALEASNKVIRDRLPWRVGEARPFKTLAREVAPELATNKNMHAAIKLITNSKQYLANSLRYSHRYTLSGDIVLLEQYDAGFMNGYAACMQKARGTVESERSKALKYKEKIKEKDAELASLRVLACELKKQLNAGGNEKAQQG